MRRAIRSNLLVVALIALSVGVGVYAAVTERSQSESSIDFYRSEVGNSDFRVHVVNPTDPDRLVEELEQRGLSVMPIDYISVQAVLPEIDLTFAQAIDVDLEQLLQHEVVFDLEGRKPEVAGEIVISRRLAADKGLKIGETTTSVSGKEVTVVGLALTKRSEYSEEIIYLPTGSLDGEQVDATLPWAATFGISGASRAEMEAALVDVVGVEKLADSDLGFDEGDRFFSIESEEEWVAAGHPYGFSDGSSASSSGAIVSSVALFQTALISAVAFIVSLRRRTLDIGRLSALGAEPAQLRRMLTAEAALLGVVGAIVGIAGGLSAVYLRANVVEPWLVGDSAIRLFEVQWAIGDLLWPGILAVIAAMVAMWFPARWAANLSPEQARNGGYKQRSIPRWLVLVSALVLAVGLFMLFISSVLVSNAVAFSGMGIGRVFLIPVSGVPIILGAAGMVYAVMGFLYNGSFRLPLPFRLSARDALRSPIRSVGAVAAYMVLLTFVVAAFSVEFDSRGSIGEVEQGLSEAMGGESSSVALSGEREYFLSGRYVDEEPFQGWVDLAEPTERVEWVRTVSEVGVGKSIEVKSLPEFGVSIPQPPGEGSYGDGSIYSAELALLGHPELLQELGVSTQTQDAMVSGSNLVLLSPTVNDSDSYDVELASFLEMSADQIGEVFTIDIESADPFGGLPVLLVPPMLAETNDWLIIESALIYNEGGFSGDELRSFQRAGYRTPGWFGGESPISPELIALSVVSIFILVLSRILSALASVDAADELASVMAVGAPARFRRTQLAWQTGYGVALAVAAAIPLGYLVGLVYAAGSVSEAFTYSPTWTIVGGLLLLPMVCAGFIFLTTRSAQPNVSQRLV